VANYFYLIDTERERIESLLEIRTVLLLSAASGIDLRSINSIITRYATHNVKSELRKIDLDPVIARVMENTFLKAA